MKKKPDASNLSPQNLSNHIVRGAQQASLIVRSYERGAYGLRPVSLEYNQFGYADASVLFTLGNTKVLAAVTLQESVPSFLRGSGKGWLTAEYAMLPTATKVRTIRESTSMKKQGRSIEISRLIGRCLRSVVDLSELGEKTITIDCEVLQADGGTRTACITAAGYALSYACKQWITKGILTRTIMQHRIAALSAGIVDGHLLVDLDQEEDVRAHADFNLVMTQSGDIIEIQGTAEQGPIPWKQCTLLTQVVQSALQDLFNL